MERTITALYDNRTDAEDGRNRLIAAGIPGAQITLHGETRAGSTADYDASRGDGFWAALKDLFVPDEDRYTYAEGLRRGGVLLSARVPETLIDTAIHALEHTKAVDIEARTAEWRRAGWSDYGSAGTADRTETVTAAAPAVPPAGTAVPATGTTGAAAARGEDRREQAIPIVEEQIRVGKREVERGSVRARSYLVETPVEEQVRLRDETVTIERRPVERELRPGEAAAFQEKTIAVTETDEEAVVAKTARVKEEVVVRKDVEQRTETVRDTVRRTEVEIEDDRGARKADATKRTPE